MGVRYHQFTLPNGVTLQGEAASGADDREAKGFMELLIPEGARVLARYEHPAWGEYAAITRNRFGKGTAVYLGCMTGEAVLDNVLRGALTDAGVQIPGQAFPVILRGGVNDFGRRVTFCLNYSADARQVQACMTGRELLGGRTVAKGETLTLAPWGLAILEEA